MNIYRSLSRFPVTVILLTLICVAQAQQTHLAEQDVTLRAGDQVETLTMSIPQQWSAKPQTFQNTQSLINVAAGDPGSGDVWLRVYLEERLDHEDALKQLREFASLAKGKDRRIFTVGGWPALQMIRTEWRPRPDHAQLVDDLQVLRIRTLVAVGSKVVIFNAALPADASAALQTQVTDMIASVRFSEQADAETVRQELDGLAPAFNSRPGRGPGSGKAIGTPLREYDAFAYSEGANARINTNGFGELEIAVDPTGQHVVVALQSRRWVSSNDGGSTFPNSGRVGAGNGDPSVGWGQSGRFYQAWIHNGCNGSTIYQTSPVPVPDVDGNPGPDPIPNGMDCTGIARSDDNGVSFQTNTVNPAVICVGRAAAGFPDNPGECFPDQEHIAVDRVNPGDTPGDDQVYSTWRNFNPMDQSATLVCSSDSGVTWSAPQMVGPGDEVFPRITVGPDGFVYVATYNGAGMFRLYKYTSCVNGLTPVAGFPANVQAGDFYQCPFAGHDRCDQDPTSQTAIVDDFDPNHVYYALVDDAGNGTSGDSNIRVHDSTDGGMNFTRVVQANAATPARRIMPWLCTTGSDAVVTWYEQSGALPSDATDYKGSRVGDDGGGSLVAKETFTISEVPDTWCDTGWACGTRWGNTDNQTSNASEACPTQPQIAGICRSPDGDNTNDSGIFCDFSDDDGVTFTNCLPAASSPSGLDEICQTRGGCPKYGDYNGNACTAGKLFAAWASANAPAGLLPPDTATNPGVLFDVLNMETDLPVVTVPGSVVFGATCSGDESLATLEVCNTGGSNLQVDTIMSDNADFAVTVPSSGFPVTISPDFCFPFEVSYTPSGSGDDSGTLTVPSDDPYRPTVSVDVSGTGDEPAIVTVLEEDFGDVCLGDTSTRQLTILNDSACDFQITSLSLPDADFSIATVMSTPFTLAGGESVSAEIDFIPVGDVGPASGTLSIGHTAANTASPKNISVQGNSPSAVVNTFIANAGAFGNVCAGDLLDLNLTVQNDGACPLEIEAVTLSGADAADFEQPAGNAAGTVVAAGNSVLIPIRFAPSAFDADPPATRTANVVLDWRTLLASSNPADDVTPVTGVVPPPDLQAAIANSGDFGEVCKTDHADLNVTLFNEGMCDLTISAVSIVQADDNFELPADLTVPLILSPDADFNLPLRYSPEMCNDTPEAATLVIDHNDPTAPAPDPLEIDLSGTSPCPNLVIDPGSLSGIYSFAPTVIDPTGTLGCFREESAILRNNGGCPLTITAITASGDVNLADFAVTAPTSFPIVLPSGEETLGTVIRFTPQTDDDPLAPSEVTGLLDVASDDPDYAGDPATGQAPLCGESVAQSGVRFLVTDITTGTPIPIDEVDSITIRSKGTNRPAPINIRLTDQPWFTDTVCGNTVSWHVDQETLPDTGGFAARDGSSYEVKAREGNLAKTDIFPLAQCELREFQLQLQSSDTEPPGACLLLPKGASCETDSECCSFKCRGPQGGKTCR